MTTDDTRRGDQPPSGEWPSRTTGETQDLDAAPSPPRISLQQLFYTVTDLSARLHVAEQKIKALERNLELTQCALREVSGHDITRIQELEQRLNRVHHP